MTRAFLEGRWKRMPQSREAHSSEGCVAYEPQGGGW